MKFLVGIIFFLFLLTTISYSETSAQIRKNIQANLIQMENLYFKYLSFEERRHAIELMDQTLKMIDSLPVSNTSLSSPDSIMSEEVFNNLIQQLKDAQIDRERSKIVASIVKKAALTVKQLKVIVSTFDWDDTRVDCILSAYPVLTDKADISLVYPLIQSSITRDKLMKEIESR